jgi:hypothetical protein
MSLQRKTLKVAALLVGAAALAVSTAHAQIGPVPVITVPGSVTQDLIVEQTLTTPSIGNTYQSYVQAISSMDAGLFAIINPQTYTGTAGIFPGYQKLPQDSSDYLAQQVATVLTTYKNALNVVLQQSQELGAEDFTAQANKAAADPAVLGELQDNTAALWQLVTQDQLIRQLLIAIATIEIVDHGYHVNDTAQMAATSSGSPLLITPKGQ